LHELDALANSKFGSISDLSGESERYLQCAKDFAILSYCGAEISTARDTGKV